MEAYIRSSASQLDRLMELKRKPQSGEHHISFETKSFFFSFLKSAAWLPLGI